MSDENKVQKVNPQALLSESRRNMADGTRSLRKKLANITGDTRRASTAITEAMQGIVHDMGTQTAQDMYTGNTNNPMATIAQHGMGHYQESKQPYSATGMKPVLHGDWEPVATLKETRIGKEVERYRVRNRGNGQKFDQEYRHYNVAVQVAAILNETNNPNDPRIAKLNQWCNQESSIILETNKMIKRYKGLDEGNVSRRNILKNQIEEKKLMLEGVRSKLGVYN